MYHGLRWPLIIYKPNTKDNWEWFSHGETIACVTLSLPLSFNQINSDYKVWEYLLYLFALGPALLYSSFLLITGKTIASLKILPEQLVKGTYLLCKFVKEFEELYYMCQEACLYFIQQKTVRVGLLACYAQWVMEIIIRNLEEEICQDLDPYANISQCAILHAQMNCIQFQIPNIQLTPLTGKDLLLKHAKYVYGIGYLLLPCQQKTLIDVSDLETDVIMDLWQQNQ
ncbi:hypothetical protein EV421DRAFT_1893511 [Armillaria borealis]|uniref:Uncharacterized protein n=1 Tax=Armillaria borealis TaxID=47425 RepID=A0AA39ME93_9AGAR|nr:hypothetical protein EV421DRAFT_1893511 [Armillaria borealis]